MSVRGKGNKSKGRKIMNIKVDKSIGEVHDIIRNGILSGSIDFTIDVEGKKVDVLEEICAGVGLVSRSDKAFIATSIVQYTDETNMGDITKYDELYEQETYPILNILSTADDKIFIYMLYGVLKSKHESCGEVIATIIFNAMREYCINGYKNLRYGVDNCIILTILYWAKQKNITSIVFNKVISKIVSEFKTLLHTNNSIENVVDYKDMLMQMNPRLGEYYYQFKVGDISNKEFLRMVVSEGGRIPIYDCDALTTSPEYSWNVVPEELTGGKTLEEIDYPDDVKKVINHIFQSYYSAVHFLIGTVLEDVLIGFYYNIKGRMKIRSLESENNNNKRMYEDSVKKLQKNKNHIRELNKKISEQREKSNKLCNKIRTLEGKVKELEDSGVENIIPYKRMIEENEKTIENFKNKLSELERENESKDRQILSLEDTNRNVYEQVEILEDEVELLNKRLGNTENNYSEDDVIEIGSIINAIRDKRIVLIGGDKIHSRMKNLGFTNIRLVCADNRTINNNDLKYADVIVIMTAHVKHSTMANPKGTANTQGIPLLYYNFSNVDRLCKEIFSYLYSDRYICENSSKISEMA